MEIIISALNTTILLILFYYQKGKNKVLEKAISSQKALIEETKNVVIQQATAIECQSKVVDTALKYSEAFDISKIEQLVRREANVDHKDEIDRLTKMFKKEMAGQQNANIDNINKIISMVIDAATESATEASKIIIEPMIPFVFRALLSMPKNERIKAIKSIKPESLQDPILQDIEKFENENGTITKNF